MTAVARGGAHIDAGALLRRAHTHHHVIAEAEQRRSRNRLDQTVSRRHGLRRPRIHDMPLALADDLEHGVVSFLRRRSGQIGLDVGIGDALLLGGIEASIGDRIGVTRPQPRDCLKSRRVDRVGGDVVDRR